MSDKKRRVVPNVLDTSKDNHVLQQWSSITQSRPRSRSSVGGWVGFAPSGSSGAASATNRSSGRSSTTTTSCAPAVGATTSATTTTAAIRRRGRAASASAARSTAPTWRRTGASVSLTRLRVCGTLCRKKKEKEKEKKGKQQHTLFCVSQNWIHDSMKSKVEM